MFKILETGNPKAHSNILLEREIDGLKISIYSHFIVIFIFYVLTTSLYLDSIWIYTGIVLFMYSGLIILWNILKNHKWVTFTGISIATLDSLAISVLPFIWWNIANPEITPSSYLIKTYTFYLISAILICTNAVSLRPLYIMVCTSQMILLHVFLLYIVATDPNTVFTDSWSEIFLTPKINLKIQYNMLFMFAILGFILIYITNSARKTILRGIDLEKKNSQLGRYFSPNIKQELANANDSFFQPGGKVQEVVILFSDIRSFTSLSEEMGVEFTIQLLTEYQKRMVKIIFEHKGTLDKFIGDGILASFGTPDPSPDDHENAIRCAINMQKEIEQLNLDRAQIGLPGISVGIGLHSGPAIVGNIGSEQRLEYTVIGDTVNTASRVESMTKELNEKILFTESVFSKWKDRDQARFVGEFALRGKKEKIKLYSFSSPEKS